MDWPQIISGLKQAGVSQQAIARHCGVAASTVSELKSTTADPSYSFGAKLLALHKQHVKPRRSRAR